MVARNLCVHGLTGHDYVCSITHVVETLVVLQGFIDREPMQPEDKNLSDLQMAVMRVLWDRGEASASEVHSELEPERGLAPTTIATVLSRLERRGLVIHRTHGRQYLYSSAVSEQDIRRSMVASLTSRLFNGDATALVSHLLKSSDIDAGDLDKVRTLLADRSEPETDDAES
jgi:BlaI family penicillinase repressor